MGNREGLQTKSTLHKTLMATMVIGVLLTLPVTAWAGLDGDGNVDAVFANFDSPTNRVCLGDGLGGFACSDVSADTFRSFGVALGDVDGDGNLDAVFANRFETNRVCLGDGLGGFLPCSDVSADTRGSGDVALGNVDGDGNLDAVFANRFETNRVCLGDGLGGFLPCSNVSADTLRSVGVAITRRKFNWPVGGFNPTAGHDGRCRDWPGEPLGCFWISDSSRNQRTVWRDAQPFQRHFNQTFKGWHLGADYNLGARDDDKGKNVYPVADGFVSKVYENVCTWGNIIFVRHDTANGPITSMYAHIDFLVSGKPNENQLVEPLNPIAKVGRALNCKTKNVDPPPHLHLEIREGTSDKRGTGYSGNKKGPGPSPNGQIDPNAFIASE